jgi:hypothetical protein
MKSLAAISAFVAPSAMHAATSRSQPVDLRHPDVHEHDLGGKPGDRGRHVVAVEHGVQGAADERVVVHDQPPGPASSAPGRIPGWSGPRTALVTGSGGIGSRE